MSHKTDQDILNYVAWEFTKDDSAQPGANGHGHGPAWGGGIWAGQHYRNTYGGVVRYVKLHGRWYWWNGQYWQPDQVQEAARLGQDLVVEFYNKARLIPDSDDRKKAMGLIRKLDTSSAISGMIRLAAQWEPIRAEPKEFDCDPWLATVANGTLDLRLECSPDSGESALLREHRQEDMLTRWFGKRAPLAYRPEATCPHWEAFLRRIFVQADGVSPDEDLIAYLRRWCGYVLTGIVTEQMLLVCHGEGQNGKRTFVQAIEEILGAYAETISIETLLAQRFESNAGPAELAKLDGARFVQCGENDAGRSLNEARVKLLTGNDPVPARHLRGDPFSFDPQFKLLLHTNHRPKIRGRDKGIWRRVKLIPFRVTIPESARDPLYFEHHLANELEGILAWMVHGCMDWQRAKSLCEPRSVMEATKEYEQDEDIVRQFALDRMVHDPEATESQQTAHAMFADWCRANGVRAVLSSRMFAMRLCDVMGCATKRSMGGKAFVGVRLRMFSDPDVDSDVLFTGASR